jgi:hypothetical protein
MNLWTCLFPDPSNPLQSARVAAPSRDAALTLLAEDIAGVGTHSHRDRGGMMREIPDFILEYVGNVTPQEPGVISRQYRDGRIEGAP